MTKLKQTAYLCSLEIFLILVLGYTAHGQDAIDDRRSVAYMAKREKMVVQQIKRRGIKDPMIINAFLKVERHRFVPERYLPNAYEDRPLPIGEGQTISQPYIVAFMTDVLNLSRSDKVLEIGTGSGYQAAILGELSDRVFTIEINEQLGRRADKLLKELGYTNVKVKIGDGYKGWKDHAPYDAILVTCAPSHLPAPLKEQLKEGGRMIIPVGKRFNQSLVLLRKTNNTLKEEKVLPVLFVPMVDPTGKKY
jgi:protein-L-isoaspartate(D-aspartate) O-methyltransferase